MDATPLTSIHIRTVSADPNNPRSFIKLIAGTTMIFTLGKRIKRRLHDRKTEHFKASFKAHFDILASGKTAYHCKVKETLFIQKLQPPLNANVSGKRLLLY